ncbi:hypothetical protein [Streptomyces sp. NPDC058086]|uniref:hypothetical protein n=1 Tax=Streptomyces sp. NPDC058086 TaxID=3346334 RepID=UPI0036EF4056
MRPRGTTPGSYVNGRETFLAAIRWEDDWPVFNEEHHEVPESDSGFQEDFTAPALHPRWISPGIHPARFAVPATGGGGVAPTAAHRASDARHLLGVRARDEAWEASAVMAVSDARLVLRLGDALRAGVEARGASLVAHVVVGGLDHALADAPRPEHGEVTLCVRAVEAHQGSPYGGPDLIELGHLDDNGFRRPAQFDGRYFSAEVAGDAVSCRRHRWARHINPGP